MALIGSSSSAGSTLVVPSSTPVSWVVSPTGSVVVPSSTASVSLPPSKSLSKSAVSASVETEEPPGVSPDGSEIFVSVKSWAGCSAGCDVLFFNLKTYFSFRLFFLKYQCCLHNQHVRWFL